MIRILCFLLAFGCSYSIFGQDKIDIITEDINRYWEAFDLVNSTSDSTEQINYLNDIFISPASKGQKAMFEARNYSVEEYRQSILNYPKFWNSIRANTLKADQFADELLEGTKLAYELYPESRPAGIYFTMGVFRSPGTTTDDMVLIGCEFAMGSAEVNTSEFSDRLDFIKKYHANDPIKKLVFLNLHEFFHTQQSTSFNTTLLTQSLREGVAEFAAVTATNKPSEAEAIAYGKAHEKEVLEAFYDDIFNYNYTYWLWSVQDNKFDQRDLAYFIGYQIAEKYYNESINKKKAIKTLLELDYTNDEIIADFVNNVRYFKMPIPALKRRYDNNRPTIVRINEFKNKATDVDPNITTISVTFSQKMNTYWRGFDVGPKGADHVLRVENFLGFDETGKTVSWEVSLEPGKEYQVLLTDRFSSERGQALRPYLISIQTRQE